MIFSGIDIVKISRIQESAKNASFCKRIFTNSEIEYYSSKKDPFQTMAGIFAAKEAFLKALGKGIGYISFNEISVEHNILSQPFFSFSGNAKSIIEKMKLQVSLSISHDNDTAVANVYAVGENMYDVVIFDLDGTLIDTSKGVLASAVYAAKKLGYEIPNEKTLRRFLGPPLSESFAEIFNVPADNVELAVNLYREEYVNQKFNGEIYNGVIDLLEFLKSRNVKMAVVTLKHEKFASVVLEHFGLLNYFDVVCGASEDNQSDKSVHIHKILEKFNCETEKAVLIGDGKYDGIGAKKAGVDFIAVNYGFARENEFENANPISFVNSPKEIAYYL
jgi:phosphoglycolate phosphatase